MTQAQARRRELLKPPEIKPTLTLFTLIACMFSVGDPANIAYNNYCKEASENAARGIPNGPAPASFNQWCNEHSVSPEKWFRTLKGGSAPAPAAPPPQSPGKKKGDEPAAAPPPANPMAPLLSIPVFALLGMAYSASSAQLGPLNFVINAAFMWIFGVVLEKKLIAWRYPLFLLIGLVGCWWLLAYEAEFIAPTQRFIGPIMFFFYMLGGYLVTKPKKPFKPAEWKPPSWKVFKGNEDAGNAKKLKVPWVSPWIYISLFAAYVAAMYFLTSTGGKELADMTHIPFMNNFRQLTLSSLPPMALQVMRPIPALETVILGVVSCYVVMNIVFKPKLLREAGDLQVQAVLQYKELRALDMNHKQAIEGTSKLIGVPLDIVKDWISKGLQTPPSND